MGKDRRPVFVARVVVGYEKQMRWLEKYAPPCVISDFPDRLDSNAQSWWEKEARAIPEPFPEVRWEFVEWKKAPKSKRRREEIKSILADGRLPEGWQIHKKPYRGPSQNGIWPEGEYTISVPHKRYATR